MTEVGLMLGLIGLFAFTVFQFGVICFTLWLIVALCQFFFGDEPS